MHIDCFCCCLAPVSDWAVGMVFWSVLLVWRELLFSTKGGLAVSKRGPVPPFSLKKGASAPFLREKGVPAKKMIPKCTDQDFLPYQYGKYREILTYTDWKIPIRYKSRILRIVLYCPYVNSLYDYISVKFTPLLLNEFEGFL
jgi:hypothetical protein